MILNTTISIGPKVTGLPRFYQQVSVEKAPEADHFVVCLDGKALKTPSRNRLKLPTPSLALAVAHEWDAQHTHGIRPQSMPLMTLASTCIDSIEDRNDIIDDINRYLGSDTICFDAPKHSEHVREKQQQIWPAIRATFEQTFGGKLGINNEDDAILGRLGHCPTLQASTRAYLDELEYWKLVSLRAATRECKSFVIAHALINRHITASEAMAACRIEEECQIEHWGLVEGGHDHDRVNCTIGLHSVSIFLGLLEPVDWAPTSSS